MYEFSNYLAHHGILRQKKGVRNGPPYPLAPSAHSAAEKRAKNQNAGKLESWGGKTSSGGSLAGRQTNTGSRVSSAKKGSVSSMAGKQVNTGSRAASAKKSSGGSLGGNQVNTGNRFSNRVIDAAKRMGFQTGQQKTTRVDKQAEKRIAEKNKLASEQRDTGERTDQAEKGKLSTMASKQVSSSASEQKSFSERFREKKMEKEKAKLESVVNKGSAKDVLKIKDKLTTEQLRRAADRLNAENQVRTAGNNAQQTKLSGAQHLNRVLGTGVSYAKTLLDAYSTVKTLQSTFGSDNKTPTKSQEYARKALDQMKNMDFESLNASDVKNTFSTIQQIAQIEKLANGVDPEKKKK